MCCWRGREAIGGTWDLFRYPGIRSDSDMYTFGYSFEPWPGDKSLADGASIREYVQATARKYGVDQKIRFGHRLTRASWSSVEGCWTLEVARADGSTTRIRANFLWMCTGYYRYEAGYTPQFAGIEGFEGQVVHPQRWPEALDYRGKEVVVIGSGGDGDDAGAGDGEAGEARDDVAALADLRDVAARAR
jgi:monooxygenase